MFEMRVVLAEVLDRVRLRQLRRARPSRLRAARSRSHRRAEGESRSARKSPHRTRVTPGFRATGRSGGDESDGHGREHLLAGQLDGLPAGQPGPRLVGPAPAGARCSTCARTATTCAHEPLRHPAPRGPTAPRPTDPTLPRASHLSTARARTHWTRGWGWSTTASARLAHRRRTAPEPMPRRDGADPREVATPAAATPASSSRPRSPRRARGCSIQFRSRLVRPRRELPGHASSTSSSANNDDWPDGSRMRRRPPSPTPPGRHQRPAAGLRRHGHPLMDGSGLRLDGPRWRAAIPEPTEAGGDRGSLLPETAEEARRRRPRPVQRRLLVGVAAARAVRQGARRRSTTTSSCCPTWATALFLEHKRRLGPAGFEKIRTVESTPGVLADPVLKQAMHANWSSVLRAQYARTSAASRSR